MRNPRFSLPLLALLGAGCSQPSPGGSHNHTSSPSVRAPLARPPDASAAPVAVRTSGGPRPAQTAEPDNAPPLAEASAPPSGPSRLELPTREAWPAASDWSDALEREYSTFVAGLGAAVAAHRCRRLDQCLRTPGANSLYDPTTDGRFTLSVDCADLPYLLRAYFSFKRGLPFGYVGAMAGRGGDPRYMTQVHPVLFRTWQQHATPYLLLHDMGDYVHSGMYRMTPELEDTDFYPVRMDRRYVVPGTTFYDPNGHVLVVTEVRADGSVYLMDGHPDGSLTYRRFGEALAVGTAPFGGGFKNFRPQRWEHGAIVRAHNRELPGYDGRSQWDPAVWAAATQTAPASGGAGTDARPAAYYDWVRVSLTVAGTRRDRVEEVREQVRGLCRDVQDRVDAVALSMNAGLQRQPHPASLPWNIYGTTGEWETFSTPSRDARLKASARELRASLSEAAQDPSLRVALRNAWEEESRAPGCHFTYTGTDGTPTNFDLGTVLDRLFSLSFDPYHCVELRWGAPEGSAERARCNPTPEALRWYSAEQRLRNQVDRFYGVATPLSSGLAEPPAVDPRPAVPAAP